MTVEDAARLYVGALIAHSSYGIHADRVEDSDEPSVEVRRHSGDGYDGHDEDPRVFPAGTWDAWVRLISPVSPLLPASMMLPEGL